MQVRNEITTTFATKYTQEVGMRQAVSLDAVRAYARQQTGRKYLLVHELDAPSKL